MNFNRFDFEQQLLQTWNITEDIQSVINAIDRGVSKDQLFNLLIGIQALQDERCNKLWDMFEAGVRTRKIV